MLDLRLMDKDLAEKPWKTQENVTPLWFFWNNNPIFVVFKSPGNHLKISGHPPGVWIRGTPRQDWFRIDPNFGTTEDMKRLVNKTHELGDMAVNWLDMVRL